jgi:hypothetical protein
MGLDTHYKSLHNLRLEIYCQSPDETIVSLLKLIVQ